VNDVFGHAIGFKAFMQPLRPTFVGVSVADEGFVFEVRQAGYHATFRVRNLLRRKGYCELPPFTASGIAMASC
jgi:hypothetical protein